MRRNLLVGVVGGFITVALLAQQGPDNDPDQAPGYTNNVFHHNQIDSINLYNGQLTIPLALGPEYPIGPKLKYQLMLTYNSRVKEYGHPLQQDPSFLYTPMTGNLALGIGWGLRLGTITPSCSYAAPSNSPCYYGPDGSEHIFTQVVSPGYYKTGDAGQLYLHFISTTAGYEMWDGDGNHYVFGWRVQGFDDGLGNFVHDFGKGRDGYYLTLLEDPFHNSMAVAYATGAAPCWSYGGTNCAATTQMKCASSGSAYLWIPSTITLPGGSISIAQDATTHMVSKITFNNLPVNGSPTGVDVDYDIAYVPETYTQACSITKTDQLTLQEIDSITFPGGSYSFDYTGGFLSGLTLPTGGQITYAYGYWSSYHGRIAVLDGNCLTAPPSGQPVVVSPLLYGPALGPSHLGPSGGPALPRCDDPDSLAHFVASQYAIISRTENGATTTYTHYAYPYGEQGAVNTVRPQELTVVVSPAGIDGASHKSAKAILFWGGPKASGANALPGDRTGADLEERIFDHDPNPAGVPSIPVCGGSPESSLCSKYAARVVTRVFEYDSTAETSNRRLQSEKTCYGSSTAAGSCNSSNSHTTAFTVNSTCGTGTSLCAWDADNGRHYNVETHKNNANTVLKTITTKWTPSTSTWLPNLFNHRTTCQDGTPCQDDYTLYEGFEFVASTGAPRGRFIWDSSQQHAWLHCWFPDSNGDPVNDFTATYTGVAAEPSLTTCSTVYSTWADVVGVGAFGNSDAFGKIRTYQNGQLLTSKWYDNIGGSQLPMGWYARRYTRNAVTGWITSSYDTAGQQTAYKYDELGRVTSVTPPGETAITVSYDSPTQTTVNRGSLSWERYIYDGLGRLTREIRQTGSSAYALRTHTFDGAGNEYLTSEWGSCSSSTGNCLTSQPPATQSSNYDPFGRPQLIVGPGNSTYVQIDRTDGTGLYTDTKETVTTCVNGTWSGSACAPVSSSSTTTRYRDYFGRITKVTEPTLGDTTYTYDVNDKLRSVGQGQARTFTYNMFGYLTAENSPEGGSVTYGNALAVPADPGYGSLGNLRKKSEPGSNVHVFVYDGAGRLATETINSTMYLENCFDGSTISAKCEDGTTNNYGGGSAPGGKLTRRIAVNPMFAALYPTGNTTEKVQEDFAYSGVGGRLSSRTTTMFGGTTGLVTGGTTGAVEGWGYNTLGLVISHDHPRVRGTFNEAMTYGYGRLSNITVSGKDYDNTSIPSISINPTFQPAGNLASYASQQLPSGTTFTTTITPDASGLPRPSQIASSTGGFNTGTFLYDAAGNIKQMGGDTFTYDPLSRLTLANYGTNSQSYTYDRYGNLVTRAGVVFCTAGSNTTCTNNKLSSGSYDVRGNLTAYAGETLSYDGASRQVKDTNASIVWQYLFNGGDERAVKVPGSATGLSVPRREIARYIVQGKGWTPASACTEGTPFADVHCTDPDYGYVKAIYDQSLTAGCGGGNYCPDTATTRSQAAVLFMKAEHGSTYSPACSGTVFSDMPCTDGTTKYAEAAYAEKVMFACGTNPVRFCPTASLTEFDAVKGMADGNLWPSYKPINGGSTFTLRGLDDQVSTEFADSLPQRDNVFVGNVVAASYLSKPPGGTGAWQFHSSDHLGTVRLTMNVGPTSLSVAESPKYWPYGDRYDTVTAPLQRLSFAVMERDVENNHYYDHARHHDFNVGRFTSVDPRIDLKMSIRNPQGWNRYPYVLGNPLRWRDPTGRVIQYDEEFRKRVKQDSVFRQAFEAWKKTASGADQWRRMAGDSNTVYTFRVGPVKVMTGVLKEEQANAMTAPIVGPQDQNGSGKLDLPKVAMTINADFIKNNATSETAPASIARAIFEEASHGLDIGSGTKSVKDVFDAEARFHSDTEPLMEKFDDELKQALPAERN